MRDDGGKGSVRGGLVAYGEPGDVYSISDDPARIDRGLVYRFLSEESAWMRGAPRRVVDRAIDHSLCFGLYLGEEQVGFARVITDCATFAYVDDVFVVAEASQADSWTRCSPTRSSRASSRGGCWPARRFFERAGFRAPEPERLRRWMTLPGGGRGFYVRREDGA